ncbi:reticulon-4a isoform X2 [Anoplopoma fimbria]|uniref:reticulon-4a isoform X2 n=1 Tax=Anoplopoma fimbria TaxID=229290 RepID=UPI0023EB296E|nr:reticulon-4a isoform X2 [Anoplopoma fimbria]
MADNDHDHVSSTTPLFGGEAHHYQAEPDSELDKPKQDLFSMDDIVDLVGGAQDALDRHFAEDKAPEELTGESLAHPELCVKEPEPCGKQPLRTTEPEPVCVTEPEQWTVPEVLEPTPPDSTSFFSVLDTPVVLEPEVPAPRVQPESSQIEPEPEELLPESDALPAAEPRKAAAEAEEEPAVTEQPAAPAAPPAPSPASYPLHGWNVNLDRRDVPSPSKAQPHPLMQFPTVVDLLYWRDVKTTGVVFGAALLLLLSLTLCSIVSVSSYIGLALLSVTICFRIYKGILQAIQKSDEGHPFKQYLDQEVALSEDVVHKYSDLALAKLNKTICELRRLFLVEDLVDSIKFAGLMWILTYVGSLFNGLTILILALVGLFSCPIVYEKHQAQIDHYVALVNNQVKDVVGKVQAKVPGMKRKAE